MWKAMGAMVLVLAGTAPAAGVAGTTKGGAPPLSVELFARNEKVIPLSYQYGDYHCVHVKPPEMLVRNLSDQAVTIKRASIVGSSEGREVARCTVHEDRIAPLMAAGNRKLNETLSALDDAQVAYRLGRIHGEPVVKEAGYCEGHVLPPSAQACLGLAQAVFFFYEGASVVDALAIEIEAEAAGGASSTVVFDLPYTPYTCRNEYQSPIAGACMVGSVPFGQSHRFANGQEFAIDILDIRRNEDGSFSTSRVPSPMVIMGSDDVSDYYIFGREVRAMADGVVLEVSDRYPDAFASNPQVHFSERNERLKQHLMARGVSPDSIPQGNYVFIDHGNGEYARYCHLREKIPVQAGDRVRQGDVIGYVGNSGDSMEPHLHLELLDSSDFRTANGLPIVFGNLDLAHALDSPTFGEKNSFVFSEFIFVFGE